MKIFFILTLSTLAYVISLPSLAQTPNQWYIDERNPTGILARVHGNTFSRREFLVAFEFEKNCEPIFSSIKMTDRAWGTLLKKTAFPPQRAFLSVDGMRYTWHGAILEYIGGREMGIGVTKEMWTALTANPKNISFTEIDGTTYHVPVGGILHGNVSNILRRAAELCISRLR